MSPLALALTLAGPAAADPVDLEWRGDSTCPSDQFRRHLDTYLRDPPPARVRATVDVRATHDRWTLDLALVTADRV